MHKVPPVILRNLVDKSHEKRRLALMDLEAIIVDLHAGGITDNTTVEAQHGKRKVSDIDALIDGFAQEYVKSPKENNRIGGLMGMAAIAISLDDNIDSYLSAIMPPILSCLTDQEGRVRYYACESLYNTVKPARAHSLVYFNEMFDGICRMYADCDDHVRGGSAMLDTLLKEIVQESPQSINGDSFMLLLKERIRIKHHNIHKLIINWLALMIGLPHFDMVFHLPAFLPPLFDMMQGGETHGEKCKPAHHLLSKILVQLGSTVASGGPRAADFPGMLPLLIEKCRSVDRLVTSVSLGWLREFVHLGRDTLLPQYANILEIVFQHMSNGEQEIRHKAATVNQKMIVFLSDPESASLSFQLKPILNQITGTLLGQKSVPSLIAALNWLSMLFVTVSKEMADNMECILPALLQTLQHREKKVVEQAITVLCSIALKKDGTASETYFHIVLNHLMQSFSENRQVFLTNDKGVFIIRKLATLMNPTDLLIALAAIVEKEKDPAFASMMVQTLNLILLTSIEMRSLRDTLQTSLSIPQGRELFISLFRCWCHNPVSTLALCLFTQAYELAAALVFRMAEGNMTYALLVQIEHLVALIESPAFLHLRIQVLEPSKCPFLLTALYGLLMLLPQNRAFRVLNTRLQAVRTLCMLSCVLPPAPGSPGVGSKLVESMARKAWWQQGKAQDQSRVLNLKSLLDRFLAVQKDHTGEMKRLLHRKSLISRTAA